MLTLSLATISTLFVAGVMILVLAFGALILIDIVRSILRAAGTDLIELLARFHSARLDRDERSERHQVMIEAADLAIESRRRSLPGEVRK